MLYYTMVCKQQKKEKKNFLAQERQFIVPVSDKKTFTVTGVFRKDV